MMFNHFSIHKNKGFTLLETVVSISILMLGVIGPITLAQRNIKVSREAGDRLVASFLAQEGIEMVRSVVSNSLGDNQDWLTNLAINGGDPCTAPGKSCIVDVTQTIANRANTFRVCNPPNGPNVCQNNGLIYRSDTAPYIYRQSDPGPGAGWTPTKFSRSITVSEVEDEKRITVTSTVTWGGKSVVLSEDIYRWFFQLN